jgi:excisionase family DNA binding protein
LEIDAMVSTSDSTASRYLTNREAAEVLRLSPRTLEKLRVNGGGPRFRKFGSRVIYAREDLEAWANARVCESTSDPEYAALR